MKKSVDSKRTNFYGWIIVAVIIAFFVSLMYDLQIISVLSYSGGAIVTAFMLLLRKIDSIMLTVLGLLLVYFLNKKEFKQFVVGLFTSIGATMLLKVFIERPRPYLAGIEVPLSIIKDSYSSWNWSFPSSHSAIPFFVIPFIPKKWRIYWIIFAVIIAFSRIYLGLHYLSDIIFGASLGLIIAYAFKKIKV